MRNRRFHRSFIILNPQDSGYSLYEGKEPAGYVKLEIRNNLGKMLLYIQDMKPAVSREAIYDVVLISSKQEIEPVKLTSIQLPDSGRGEYEITFDPENVAESKYKIGDYHALAVVERQLNNRGVFRYPLVGYSDKKVKMDWSNQVSNQLMRMYGLSRGKTVQDLSEEQDSELLEEDTEKGISIQNYVADQEELSEELDDQIDPELLNFVPPDISYIYEDSTTEANIQEDDPNDWLEESEKFDDDPTALENDSFDIEEESILINEQQTVIEDEQMTFDDEPVNLETKSASSKNQPADSEDKGGADTASQDFYSMPLGNTPYWSRVEEYYNRLFENHKRVTPFDDAIGEVDWIRVENRNQPAYPCYGVYNPYYHYRQYGSGLDHYLVGLMRNKGKVQYVIYGIPGIYSAAPPMSMHGFSRWLPVKNGYGAGYWLLYIDALTGNIAYPY